MRSTPAEAPSGHLRFLFTVHPPGTPCLRSRDALPRLPARAVWGLSPQAPGSARAWWPSLHPASPGRGGSSPPAAPLAAPWPPPRPARKPLTERPALLLPLTVLWRGIFAAQRASASAWLQTPSHSNGRARPGPATPLAALAQPHPRPPSIPSSPGRALRSSRGYAFLIFDFARCILLYLVRVVHFNMGGFAEKC